MKHQQIFPFFIFFLIILHFKDLSGQISHGGVPLSYSYESQGYEYEILKLKPPDTSLADLVDDKSKPPLIGLTVKLNVDFFERGTIGRVANEGIMQRLAINIPGANGLGLYYSEFYIPEGGSLFIYSEDKRILLGSFTHENNPESGSFATEIIPGDMIILEYNHPEGDHKVPEIVISEVLYVLKEDGMKRVYYGFGDSGPCEVNVNCPEGDTWKDEKRGVAKIVLKEGSGAYLCTGSLINNTRQDSTPYFLTANHCGPNASTSDYSQWMFYFNYEALGCADPSVNPPSQTITGSALIAKGFDNPSIGSDFKLLLLDQKIPETYNPYFNGWNTGNTSSSGGVGIHHPKGDIKKISTYNESLVSSEYNSSGQNPDAMFWRVVWAETESGHGVTEGGSSGSPIFDQQHHIAGTLTGGAASCQNPDAPDFYGKFSYHWQSNGNTALFQLKPWLDPDNTGKTVLEGFGYGNILSASFSADPAAISVGETIIFQDHSSGKPSKWDWYFEGGNPGSSTENDSVKVRYFDVGKFDVKLVVSDGSVSDTLLKNDYVIVKARFYPNPADDHLLMDFGNTFVEEVSLEIFDSMGNRVKEFREEQASNVYRIQLPDLRKGLYFFGYTVDGVSFEPEKIVVL